MEGGQDGRDLGRMGEQDFLVLQSVSVIGKNLSKNYRSAYSSGTVAAIPTRCNLRIIRSQLTSKNLMLKFSRSSNCPLCFPSVHLTVRRQQHESPAFSGSHGAEIALVYGENTVDLQTLGRGYHGGVS